MGLLVAALVLGLGLGLGRSADNHSAGLLEFSVGKFRHFTLQSSSEEAVLRHIASNVTFVIFQIHTQYKNATVSFNKNPPQDTSGPGTDKGLITALRLEQTICTWFLQAAGPDGVKSVAGPLSYSEKDPVPGGCNLEFDLDVDPNIYLDYNLFETVIKFAPANLGSPRGRSPPPCDVGTGMDSRWRLQYDVYQYFLAENELLAETLLESAQRMAVVPQLKGRATKVATLTSNDKTTVYFSSLPGQGVIYNVIVRDPVLNTSAAYVPAHTYACSFDAVVDNCFSLGRISTKVFFTLFSLLGLFICFFGHRFWKTVRLTLTAVAGSLGGVLLVACWWRFGLMVVCMLCVGLVLGFLVSATVFFTPLGDLKIFRADSVFWVTFSCIVLVVPMVFIGCLRILNILACGITGSYSVILAINSYFYTSLSYITLNVLKRALNTDFSRAYTNVPFQTNDFIILAVWGMLAVSGITLQIRRERGRPFFPPHPYKVWKREKERRVTNILDPSHHVPPLRDRLYGRLARLRELFRKEQPAGERTPLLL
ncbi:transmembrane 7 superfamily member 3 isoform X2 [Ornithorhynchus anatinus]|uniref:Transmembrane 7 superfamily member 3 n=1 Tax=Ornithorhynchus anatinus TaxID=9258 RepID=A0A6I8NTI9_ORNAN|nr:transmembrane 7 superfamily member 3 isoform X2 [Ornithorhynchus anatinus]